MTVQNKVTVERDDRVLILERIFEAPRELVFTSFSDCEHLEHWWGPKGWTLPVCEMDFRPGGRWHYCMRGPDGEESWGLTVYREIVAPERLVYTDSFSDEEGNIVDGMPTMLITVEFAEYEDNRTKLTSRTEFASVEELESVVEMGAIEGISETWDRLDDYLATVT
ncbi:MAG TPA: SRPBCC domain-containing protein [Candidatus Sulfomarinibacteraceae bacterium]|nr:SRPBCC domain-containing protein [Candidatus Sulfomarinibacteraceae bacterium]